MKADLENLEKTLGDLLKNNASGQGEISDILIWLEKYVSIVYRDKSISRKGDELKTALDAALNISIQLLEGIDSGTDGLDDKLVEELKKVKKQYLGA